MTIEMLLIAFLVLAFVIVIIGYIIAKVILKNDIGLFDTMGTFIDNASLEHELQDT